MDKLCTLCHTVWVSQNTFLADPTIQYHGYQVNFRRHEFGFFLFNHIACGTTVAFHVKDFGYLYDGITYNDVRTGKEDCTGYCLNKRELRPCPAPCKFSEAREIMQKIVNYPKQY